MRACSLSIAAVAALIFLSTAAPPRITSRNVAQREEAISPSSFGGPAPFALRQLEEGEEGELFCNDGSVPISSQPLRCRCSPTGGSGTEAAKEFLQEGSDAALDTYDDVIESGDSADIALGVSSSISEETLDEYVRLYGDIACIDSDASFRVEGDRLTGLYCIYILETGENVSSSPVLEIDDCSDTRMKQPVCLEAKGSEPGGSSRSSLSSSEASEDSSGSSSGASEGCVDVSALPPCRRLHTRDIVADVLCVRGLCATPNHELVIDGKRTSTSAFCRGGNCTQTRMAVNSCYYRDLEGGGFVHESGIGITSWDVRYPRFATMLVQDAMFALRAAAVYFAGDIRSEL